MHCCFGPKYDYTSPETQRSISVDFAGTLTEEIAALQGETRQALFDSIPEKLAQWKPNPAPKFTGTKWIISLIIIPTGFFAFAAILTAAMGGPGFLAVGLGSTAAGIFAVMLIALGIVELIRYRLMHKPLDENEKRAITREWHNTIKWDIWRDVNSAFISSRYGTPDGEGHYTFTVQELDKVRCLRHLAQFAEQELSGRRDKQAILEYLNEHD